MDGGEGDKRVENLTMLRYLGIPLDQRDDDCLAVRRNIMRARSVGGRLGTLLRQEGTEPRELAIFYRSVMKAILLYESETWVLLESMERKVEGTNFGFLFHIKGKRARALEHRTRETHDAEGVQEAAGEKLASIYIERQQATVAQWVALRPLFEVFAMDTGYEGGSSRREA